MKINRLWFLCLLLLLGACHRPSNPTAQSKEGNGEKTQLQDNLYPVALPFKSYRQRQDHQSRLAYRSDLYEVTKGLQEMALTHFDPNQLSISEGQVLTSDLYSRLLRYNGPHNSVGLNPNDKEAFISESGKAIFQPVLLLDIVELDYYRKEKDKESLAGVSFGLVLNRTMMKDQQEELLPLEDLIAYGENIGRQLVSVVKNLPNMSQVPVLVALFVSERVDAMVPGSFVSSAYFEGHSGQFKRQMDQWFILPSASARQASAELADEFDRLRHRLEALLPDEEVGVVGKLKIKDNKSDRLEIEVFLTGQTYVEVQAVSQLLAQSIDQDLDVLVPTIVAKVYAYKDVLAVVEKKGTTLSVVVW